MSDPVQDGLHLLARRPLTRHEVTLRLRRLGHDEEAVEAAVSRLVALAVVDDRALALHWIGSQAVARGRGRDRCIAELAARGVAESVAAAAWSEAMGDGAIDAAALLARAVRRRLGSPPNRVDGRRLARVYNALLQEGFGADELEAALGPYGFKRTEE